MEQTSPSKRKNIGLVVLSVIDVVTGILSLVVTAIAVQVIAIMASGLTLVKAIKVVVQSEKTAILVKPVAIYAVRKLTRSEKMKAFFKKIKENIKNNPLTLTFSFVVLVICGGLGYALLDFVARFPWAVGWKLYALAFGGAAVVYAILLAITVRLGHDNAVFASIRRLVKSVGGDKAVEVLDAANNEVIEAVKAENERKAAEEAAKLEKEKAEKAKREEEEAILKYAKEREAEKARQREEAERVRLLNQYRGEYEHKQEGGGDDHSYNV